MAQSEMVLLHGDVDAIKEYVFETSSLPQIRGGSQILIECEKAVCAALEGARATKIYCSGGSFLFEVPAEQANDLAAQVQRIYLDRTLTATVTVVVENSSWAGAQPGTIPSSGLAARLARAQPDEKQSAFGRRVAFLAAEVRRCKQQHNVVPFFESLPFGMRCQECGRRMAQKEILRRESGGELIDQRAICPVCDKRIEAGSRKGLRTMRGQVNTAFDQKHPGLTSLPPEDLGDMVTSAQRGYLAFLYADGNSIGSLLRGVSGKEQYKQLSEALEQGLTQALFDALYSVCGEALRTESVWPFEILHAGGDDIAVILQAGYAWDVAVAFLGNFEREMQTRLKAPGGEGFKERITASCGILYAGKSYPVRYMQRLAEGLLRRAKRHSRDHEKGSSLDFFWLTSDVASERVEPLLAVYERKRKGQPAQLLSARPYTLAQAVKMKELVEQARSIMPTQRHIWREALSGGVDRSLNTIYYNIARQPEAKRPPMITFLNEVTQLIETPSAAGGVSGAHRLWVPGEHLGEALYRTALGDVLELADLQAMRGGQNNGVEGEP